MEERLLHISNLSTVVFEIMNLETLATTKKVVDLEIQKTSTINH